MPAQAERKRFCCRGRQHDRTKKKGADRFHGPRQDSTRSGGELEACEPIGQIVKLPAPAPPTPGSGWCDYRSRITFGSLIRRTDSTVIDPLPTNASADAEPV